VLVDTPRVFEISVNSVTAAGNSIPLEMGVYNAGRVRLVFVDGYQALPEETGAFQSIGEILPQIVPNETEVPILFLYNRFINPPGVEIAVHEPEGMIFIVERTKLLARKMREGLEGRRSGDYEKLISELNKSLTRGLRENSGNSPDFDFKSHLDLKRLRKLGDYIPIMKSSFKAGRVVHFDPMSNDSIETRRQDLLTLKPSELKEFDFRATKGDRIKFDHKLDVFPLSLNVHLSTRLNLLVFPDSVLLSCKPIIETRIQFRVDDLKLFVDADMTLNKTHIKKLQSKYHHIAEEDDPEFHRLTHFVSDCQKEQRKLEAEIESIENSTVIIYQTNCNLTQGLDNTFGQFMI
jgi:hypothetical protein